jgi:hypothetical protein
MASKRTFGIRLSEELVEAVDKETQRRAKVAGVKIALTSMVEALVKERLAQIQEAGR